MGVVSSVGADRASFARALREGVSGIGPLTLFATTGYRSSIAGEVRDFRPAERLGRALPEDVSRTDALALVAAAEALDDARWPEAERGALGVVVGGTTGGMPADEVELAA